MSELAALQAPGSEFGAFVVDDANAPAVRPHRRSTTGDGRSGMKQLMIASGAVRASASEEP